MPDVFTKAKRSQVMSRIRSSGNLATELAMISLFRKHGIVGWRRGQVLKAKSKSGFLRIRPDFLFPGKGVVLFVDGEFWHGHPKRCQIPKTRTVWWSTKIKGNVRRDKLQNRVLRTAGWTVVRVWEFELKATAVLRKLKRAGLL